ncbi:MAG: hypothetical protein LBD94_01845 [Rickettsiales bacterium]|jgi:hypothetical protein|nr:hypothetical protein [Rickettsiales bacterium]
MDILLLDGKGNPLTQPKWLAKKLFQDLEFIGWDFSKINDQFIHLIRDELNGAKGSEKDVVALLNKKLLEKIKPMINEQLKKKNPMATTHIECEEDAPPYLKESVLNIDYLTGIVDSIPNFIRTNDENWHFQCTNVREYGIITIDMAMRASEAHIARVKKECEDFARHAALGYNRKVKKGLEILLFKGVHFDDPTTLTRREFECSDLNFNKNNLVTFGEIKDKLSTIAARQKMLRQTGR